MDALKTNAIQSGFGQHYLDGKYLARHHEDTITQIEIIASSCNDPAILFLLLQSPQASSAALTEIASHPDNHLCWERLISHCNATPFHFELLLDYEYEYDSCWFELEKLIARSPVLNEDIGEIIFLRNSEYHRDYRYFSRKFSERRLILYALALNQNLSETLRANCVKMAFPQEALSLQLLQKTA